MKTGQRASIWVTSVLLAALVALYGLWIVTETPSYWETFLFVTLLMLMLAAAIIRLVPFVLTYFATGKEPHLERDGERTYRRCGLRELTRVVLWILILRVVQLLLTYLIHFWLFGYTETFFRVQRIWLDFYHVEMCFPAYPLLSNLFWFVTFNFNHARFLSAYFCTAVAGAMLYYWTLLDFDRSVARRAVLIFFLLPASFLLLGTLPDALFLLFSMICLMFARKRQFVLANLFAMLSVMTHVFGALLFVPCIIEFAQTLREDMQTHREEGSGYLWRRISAAVSFLLIPLGFVLVMLYSDRMFGSPTALFEAAQSRYGYHASLPFSSVAALCDRFLEALRTTSGNELLYELGNTIPNLLYLLLGAAMLILAPGRIRTSYIAYMLITFFAVLCAGVLLEAPRLLSLCTPFLLTLVLSVRKRAVRYPLFFVSFALLLLYLTAVVGGYTIYGV
ncbi:MAG: hypothetical protein IJP98_01085 [Clostridia bacterium]|nr:hypothetical protein [Clostridia bacterium]